MNEARAKVGPGGLAIPWLVLMALALGWQGVQAQPPSNPSGSKKPPRRTLADLLPPGSSSAIAWEPVPPPSIRDADLAALGIRKIAGKHVAVYTDLPPSPAVDELPTVFDAALPLWCAYFGVPVERTANWQTVAYVMQDKERFQRAGRLPADLPEFLNGYQRGSEFWLYEQPSDYYRRHLLLHEGTHGFMRAALGGCGPPWYMEGMAELLATHQWEAGRLTLNYFPANKQEVEQWGRVKIVRDAYQLGKARQLFEIMNLDGRAHLQVENYGWCWAAAAFLDGHPHYQQRFRELRKFARDEDASTFAERFIGWMQDDWYHANREWQLFVARLDYGYDVAREAIAREPAEMLPANGKSVTVAADHGWQSTGIRLEAGQRYQITAAGRYQLGNQPKIWWCEPNGITVRYCGGKPLGILLGAIVEESDATDTSNGFLTAAAIGPSLETKPRRGGTLYLRVNDYPTELVDNQGELTVEITPLP